MAVVDTQRPTPSLSLGTLVVKRLPRWAPYACVALGLVLVGGLSVLAGSWSPVGTGLGAAVVFAASWVGWTWRVEGKRRAKDRMMTALVWAAFLAALIPLVSVAITVISHGVGRLNGYFLTVSMRGVFGGMDAGGVYHAIVGTVEITGLATLISVPVGIMCAIYLVEYGRGAVARAVTFFVDVMTGIPSVVAGLFAYALFALFMGPAFRAGIIGAVALSVLMIPVVVRSAEEMLRLVPNELREAALALGVPKWRMVVAVVLRTAAGGLVTAVMLAIARVIGETAPLLLTVGVIDSINTNPFDGRMMTLPVYVYRQFQQGLVPCAPGASDCIASINYDRAWAAALVLILIVMAINLIARVVAHFFAPKVRN